MEIMEDFLIRRSDGVMAFIEDDVIEIIGLERGEMAGKLLVGSKEEGGFLLLFVSRIYAIGAAILKDVPERLQRSPQDVLLMDNIKEFLRSEVHRIESR